MNDALYREIILEEYKHPKNHGRLERPTHVARIRNSSCGDELHVTLDVADDTIRDVRFEGTGCAVSQAAASLFTERIKGLAVADVQRMDEEEIVRLLGVRPNPMRMKCAVLVLRAVADALEDKRQK